MLDSVRFGIILEHRIILKWAYQAQGAFTLDAKQLEANVGNFREWSLTTLAQNRLTIQKQFCLSEVKQPLAKFASGRNLAQVVDDVIFW